VALLVGGGGTLAVWNSTAQAEAGSIAAGDLKLTAGVGTWKNAQGATIGNIASYKVVPGDKLTFTQQVNVVLDGDLMKADLGVTGPTSSEFLTISPTTLTNKDGAAVGVLDQGSDGDYTATVSVEFPSASTGATNATQNLGALSFKLDQIAPGTVQQ
jgi:alternate signal-mediated exported protein